MIDDYANIVNNFGGKHDFFLNHFKFYNQQGDLKE